MAKDNSRRCGVDADAACCGGSSSSSSLLSGRGDVVDIHPLLELSVLLVPEVPTVNDFSITRGYSCWEDMIIYIPYNVSSFTSQFLVDTIHMDGTWNMEQK
jgi:hypothetical protein